MPRPRSPERFVAVGPRRRLDRAADDAATPPSERRLLRGRIAELAREGTNVGPPPDLLHPEPVLAVDAAAVRAVLDFAFAGGSCEQTLDTVMEGTKLAPSSWDGACFARDLFLHDLVAQCFRIDIDGWRPKIDVPFLTRLLCEPPSDAAVVAVRHEVLRELEGDAALRARFGQLYRLICRLGARLGDPTINSTEARERRLEVLTLVRDIVRQMSEGFVDCTSVAARVAAFGCHLEGTEGYRALLELLDFDEHLATVDVQLQLGADGQLRRFTLVGARENEENPFWTSPWGRWLLKIRLWWRGYHLSENQLVERWLVTVFDGLSPYLPALFQLRAHMEVYLAALAFRDACTARGLKTCLPVFIGEGEEGGSRMEGLFNPLLFAQGLTPRICDVALGGPGGAHATTIVTGPNSGGKTRLLQAIGLCQTLAHAGLFVPACAARLRRIPGMFVSIIEAPTAEQREGRLGTELIRIRRLFEQARSGALVLLDELCSGTNPSEGEEIFVMVLELLAELKPDAVITSHFLSLAERLAREASDNLAFLQVELEGGQATYRFVPGVATSSLAAQTAARLGVTRTQLLEIIRRGG